MSIDEIKKLDVKDRIILMNDIWESLESESSKIESPNWHKDILEERIEKIKNGEANFISLEKLKNL
ncbi:MULTISPECIES: addiction module protein [Aliarcobacter]|uniref:addiction module protein n=1 Tax=Aliarcobacter TaxID=2321111 RepID=UPI0021B2D57A|nr:addiction module protein [Aliarcobacter cryaerophilus]MCT7522589.1 addiction module protein [Aliarcobacter cryaerophilus]